MEVEEWEYTCLNSNLKHSIPSFRDRISPLTLFEGSVCVYIYGISAVFIFISLPLSYLINNQLI